MKSYRKPRRYKHKKSVFKSKFFWLAVFILIILGTLFYLAVFYEKFQIKEIKISGNEKINPEEIRKIAEEQIVKKILFFSSKSIFLMKSDELAKTLLDVFPGIAEVKTKRNLPDALTINIKEREAVGVWAENVLVNDSGAQSQKYFLIDKEGIILEEVAEPGDFLVIKSQDPKGPVLGKEIIAKKYIEMILDIEKQLKEKTNITAKDFIIASDKITATVFEGWQIYFDSNGSASSPQDNNIPEQISNLTLTLQEKIPLEKRSELEYIDLRFGNRVYFRYRTSGQ